CDQDEARQIAQHQMHLLRVADDMHKGLTYDHLHH
ncbi:hypothetical protein ECDEC4B_2988, partial [Escherichia coli DEC4B]